MVHTTAFVTPVVEHWLERQIGEWVYLEGSIQRPTAPEKQNPQRLRTKLKQGALVLTY